MLGGELMLSQSSEKAKRRNLGPTDYPPDINPRENSRADYKVFKHPGGEKCSDN